VLPAQPPGSLAARFLTVCRHWPPVASGRAAAGTMPGRIGWPVLAMRLAIVALLVAWAILVGRRAAVRDTTTDGNHGRGSGADRRDGHHPHVF
jgi:hypothetical protein